MIAAENYLEVYLIFVTLLTFIVGAKYSTYKMKRVYIGKVESIIPSLILSVLMIVYIGFRPISIVFADTLGYANAMVSHAFEDIPIHWDNNYLFVPLMAFLSSHNASPQTPLIVLAFINIGATFLAVRKLFPNDTLLALLTVFGAFIYFATATNGLKAGCAAGLLLCSLAYRDKLVVSLVFLFLSFGFHHSMQMAVVAYVICLFYKNNKFYFVVWLFCLLCAVFHITYFQYFFGELTDEQGAGYLLSSIEDSGFGGRKGFRIDFVLYSSVPVIVGYYAIFKKRIRSVHYSFILNMYLLLNGVWMLCMYAPYTNRIAEISWGVFPIVLVYPFLKEKWGYNQYGTAKKLVYGNVLFSCFMTFVYYAFIHLNR